MNISHIRYIIPMYDLLLISLDACMMPQFNHLVYMRAWTLVSSRQFGHAITLSMWLQARQSCLTCVDIRMLQHRIFVELHLCEEWQNFSMCSVNGGSLHSNMIPWVCMMCVQFMPCSFPWHVISYHAVVTTPFPRYHHRYMAHMASV